MKKMLIALATTVVLISATHAHEGRSKVMRAEQIAAENKCAEEAQTWPAANRADFELNCMSAWFSCYERAGGQKGFRNIHNKRDNRAHKKFMDACLEEDE